VFDHVAIAVSDLAVQIAARPAGMRPARGSSKPRLGCPYWKMTPTETGWIWEQLRTVVRR
jgi:hypothetical protein